ncbi:MULTISPECIES: hypothetical protein [Arthrobacter]|uniref:hypothetical protein n=1 Tax=Arthrobacter TaxID=1663 RepID=UPI001E34F55E|nr:MULTISPECIES: hypothetical protein [Arthrobacter]
MFPVTASSVDAVVITHAYLDHTGCVPALVGEGFRGPIHATTGTAELCTMLLLDSGHLQEKEARYAQHQGTSTRTPPLPLYTAEDAVRLLKYFRTHEFDQPFDGGEVSAPCYCQLGTCSGPPDPLVDGREQHSLHRGFGTFG